MPRLDYEVPFGYREVMLDVLEKARRDIIPEYNAELHDRPSSAPGRRLRDLDALLAIFRDLPEGRQ